MAKGELMTDNTNYNELLGLICSVFESYSVVLLLEDPGSRNLKVASSFSMGDEIDNNATKTPGPYIVERNPILVNNVDQAQTNLGYYKNNSESIIKSFMACPLPGGKGMLCLDSKRQYAFSTKDQKILQMFASVASDFQQNKTNNLIHNEVVSYYARLHQIHGLRAKFNRWNVFLQHYLQIIADATGFSYCFFVARNETGDKYFIEGENEPNLLLKNKETEFPMGSGLMGWIFREGNPLFAIGGEAALGVPLFNKATAIKDLQAVCCLPLNINKVTRGVLCLAHDQPVEVTQEMKDFLTMSSDHLALFLENLYLKNKLHQAKKELSKHI